MYDKTQKESPTKPVNLYILHTSTGRWELYARSPGQARLDLAELSPGAIIHRIERAGEW